MRPTLERVDMNPVKLRRCDTSDDYAGQGLMRVRQEETVSHSGGFRGTGAERALESPLFRSKLRRPVTPEHFVVRTRLHDLVDDLLTYPLTLVIAPAGVGKTSLLAGWAAAAQVPSAWLTIDETDRDGVQLWTGMVAALEPVISHGADQALDAIRRPRTQPDAVGAILADLESSPREPMVLILDDVHLLDEDPIQADLLAT